MEKENTILQNKRRERKKYEIIHRNGMMEQFFLALSACWHMQSGQKLFNATDNIQMLS